MGYREVAILWRTVEWCATELFLWRMVSGAPQKFFTFYDASLAHAPQNVRGSHVQAMGPGPSGLILWRTVAGAP